MPESPSDDGVVLLTGCTGFLGRRILWELAGQGRPVLLLAQPDELPRAHATVARLARRFPRSRGRVTLFGGDVHRAGLGLDADVSDRILRDTAMVIHAHSAGPGPKRSAEQAAASNVRAVESLLAFAHRARRLGVFALASSVGVGGDYPGTFYEDWLDVGQGFADVLDRAAFEVEVRVRNARRTLPVTVFRAGILIGDSETGEVDRDHGLGPLVRLVGPLRALPMWFPLPGPEGDSRVVPIAPVDFVARGLLALAGLHDSRGLTFCLADPDPPTLRQFLDLVTAGVSIPRARNTLSAELQSGILSIPGLLPLVSRLGHSWGLPLGTLGLLAGRNRHDTTRARAALGAGGISCPPVADYLHKVLASHLRAAA